MARLFLLEVLLVGAAGSALGLVAGTGLSLLLARGFAILKNVSTDLDLLERAGIGAVGLAAGVGVCLLGALSPLRRTRRIEPLVVLKGE